MSDTGLCPSTGMLHREPTSGERKGQSEDTGPLGCKVLLVQQHPSPTAQVPTVSRHEDTSPKRVAEGVAHSACREPDGKHFRLCGPYGFL